MAKIKPPVPWYGGKYYLAEQIVEYFPPHRTYVEPYGGGASVLLNKDVAPIEVYNDLDEKITRFFRVLRDQPNELVERLEKTPYSEIEFNKALVYEDATTDLEKACCDFTCWRQSFGSAGDHWRYSTTRTRGGVAEVVNTWHNAIKKLQKVSERFKFVQIFKRDALKVIELFDHKETLLYCDPPYVHETRSKGACDIYDHEMTNDDHKALIDKLLSCKSQVVLSGYDSSIYNNAFKKWQRVEFDTTVKIAQGSKNKRTEILWIKP